jgi:hypothetical protein
MIKLLATTSYVAKAIRLELSPLHPSVHRTARKHEYKAQETHKRNSKNKQCAAKQPAENAVFPRIPMLLGVTTAKT